MLVSSDVTVGKSRVMTSHVGKSRVMTSHVGKSRVMTSHVGKSRVMTSTWEIQGHQRHHQGWGGGVVATD